MTAHKHKLSLFSAILINLNIMLGSGIFINTVLLSKAAGGLGALTYLLVGILMLPLIWVIAELLKYHQGGTFYEFGRSIHPLVGFISSWSYFTAKLASSALGIHIFVTLVQKMVPSISSVNPLILDSIIICLFTSLNMFNLHFGRSVQYIFVTLKFIPILFVLISALFFFSGNYYALENLHWDGILGTIPFVLFAFSGFEASCSLSRSIENPEKNGPLAILISFGLVLTVVTLYQIDFFGLLGPALSSLPSFREAYPAVSQLVFPHSVSQQLVTNILTLSGIAASSLGASYGILYSNSWNLYSLGQHGHTLLPNFVTKLNKHNMPIICIITEAVLALGYIWFSGGNQVPLQQISALGSTIAYSISALSFILISLFITRKKQIFALSSLITCTVLIGATIRNGFIYGFSAYLLYSVIIFIGIIMFFLRNQNNS